MKKTPDLSKYPDGGRYRSCRLGLDPHPSGRGRPVSVAAQTPSLVQLAFWSSLVFGIVFLSLQTTGLDLWVSARFYDPALHGFPLRDDFWYAQVLHDGGRKLMLGFVLLVLALWLASWRVARLRGARKMLGYLVLAMLTPVVLVAYGKQLSNVDCPWSLQIFGGTLPHFNLFQDKPDALPHGACFPGGHSSGGFALFALYFAGRAHGIARPRWLLVPGALVGSVFAFDQWARGAHFPSHDLATAYLCWICALVIYAVMYPCPKPN